MQESAARRVFQQMLDALDYCHKQGIYHRCARMLVALLACMHVLIAVTII